MEQILKEILSELKDIHYKLDDEVDINTSDITSNQDTSNQKLSQIIDALNTLCDLERDGLGASALNEHLNKMYDALGEIHERLNNIENNVSN